MNGTGDCRFFFLVNWRLLYKRSHVYKLLAIWCIVMCIKLYAMRLKSIACVDIIAMDVVAQLLGHAEVHHITVMCISLKHTKTKLLVC